MSEEKRTNEEIASEVVRIFLGPTLVSQPRMENMAADIKAILDKKDAKISDLQAELDKLYPHSKCLDLEAKLSQLQKENEVLKFAITAWKKEEELWLERDRKQQRVIEAAREVIDYTEKVRKILSGNLSPSHQALKDALSNLDGGEK